MQSDSPAGGWRRSSSTKAESQEQEKRDWAGNRLGTQDGGGPSSTTDRQDAFDCEREASEHTIEVHGGTKCKRLTVGDSRTAAWRMN